jgi:hypothetical protein
VSRPRTREARTPEGDKIVSCKGCGAWPVRESWLEPHDCGLEVCRICRDEGGCICLKASAA